jgi:hypothetical protein
MELSRRTALRLVGGGVLAAALPGCDGWSVPDSATTAWRNAGSETDLRRRALSYASAWVGRNSLAAGHRRHVAVRIWR